MENMVFIKMKEFNSLNQVYDAYVDIMGSINLEKSTVTIDKEKFLNFINKTKHKHKEEIIEIKIQ